MKYNPFFFYPEVPYLGSYALECWPNVPYCPVSLKHLNMFIVMRPYIDDKLRQGKRLCLGWILLVCQLLN